MKSKNIIFLGKKGGAIKALRFLNEKKASIKFVVADPNERYWKSYQRLSREFKFKLLPSDAEIYELIKTSSAKIKNIDLVISYLYPKKIKQPLINIAKSGCINFHPAPLPDYKGRAGYNTAILEERDSFGVSAHFIDSEEMDNGPIIKVLKFKIDKDENVLSLYNKSQKMLLRLFKEVILDLLSGKPITVSKNKGGLYLTGKQLEELKIVDIKKDSIEEINKKIKAFFFPPYTGAKITIKGEKFTLVNSEIMTYLAKIIKQ